MQLKVNIARKQPMLDAATGKSVWGSLGKDGALPSPFPIAHHCGSLHREPKIRICV